MHYSKQLHADLSIALLHHCNESRIESESGSTCVDPPHLLCTVHSLSLWNHGPYQIEHHVVPQHLSRERGMIT